MALPKMLPDSELLIKLLSYDANTGELTWKPRDITLYPDSGGRAKSSLAYFNKFYSGKRADSRTDSYGYRIIKILGERYLAHRVVWKIVTGHEPSIIDHINRDRLDNRFLNLRDTDALGNSWNRECANVWQVKKNGLWRGELVFKGRVIRVCSFECREDAEKAIKALREAFFAFPLSACPGAFPVSIHNGEI